MKALLTRSFDFKQIRAKIWYVPIIFLMPGASIVTYGLILLMRMPLPTPEFPVVTALIMFFVFFAEALCEEVGWMGYAVDKMQSRWNALCTSVLLGLVTAAWHIIPFLQVNRSPSWIAWQCLLVIASRVLIVWIYNNTGRSVFGSILFHVMINMSSLFFPNYGSHYNPQITSLIIVCTALAVTTVWGPQIFNRPQANTT
jgi:membrane protease YdiL (CAAX protease family)